MSKQSKLKRTSLAILAAGTFSFSSTFANANETFETVDFRDGIEEQSNVSVNDEAVMDSVQEELDSLEEVQESPSLLPGDFFYFAKLILEKVKLAFTADEVKEAKLLAQFASERLAEAQALFEAGEEDMAIETIKKALEAIEESDTANEDKEVPADTDDVHLKDDRAEQEEKEKEIEEETLTGEVTEETEQEEESHDEREEVMVHNIIALKAAMEKVKNPAAKAALKKNIEKSYAKLAAKIVKSAEKKESDEPAVEEETVADSTEEAQASIPVPSVKKAEKEQKADKEKNKAEREMEGERLKAEHNAEKEKIKANHETEKEKVRAEREKQKEERKAAKEAGKKEHKENKGKGHGNKENNGNSNH
ncbi:DUF5667 domain-containing protein [Rossellomorea vietnamensis]|uniref:DUF5667 domain-containing protein n=1 Tax=Rossellomorea vietnamensis TaxID=218284 RepID=UPI003CE90552